MVGVYKIQSPSGKVYIGQSWNIKKRISDHKRTMSNKHRKLNASFLKYGVNSHLFKVVHILPYDISQEDLNTYEVFYMELYRDCGVRLLNIKEGGNGFGKHSEETKKIISEKRKMQIFSEESKLKKSQSLKKVIKTKEWIEKIAASQRGKKISYEIRKKAMKPILQLGLNGDVIKEWDCSRIAAKELGTTETNICNCLTKRSKTAKGFKWAYKQ
jgi:group I intron endonuclease